ncbi:hypothetical protein Bca4012_065625 [Brassica carinata]
MEKQCSLGIDGLRSSLSTPSIDSSSLTLSASKSEHEDSIFRDYTLDLSFLSSDDSLSNLSRDVDTTKESELLEDKVVLLNPNPLVSKLPEMLIGSSTVAGDGKLELSCPNNTTGLSENSSTDSEEDTPCWIGINSRKTLASGSICRRSTDDLSGFRRLNPSAPKFIPSNSKKILEKDGKSCEERGSPSLKKCMSSDFPSSSGEFNFTHLLEDAASILTHNADESLGFVSQGSDSRNEFQQYKRLDPSAPVFVPSNAKLSPSVHETNAHSASALNKSLGKVKVDTPLGEAGRAHISSSYNPWLESKVGIKDSAKLGSSSNKSLGQRRLNPLAPQFSFADTKPNAYRYDKYQAADDFSLMVNPTGYTEHNVAETDLAQSSMYVEPLLPNMSRGSSSHISPTADSNFGSTKWYAVEPNTTVSVNGNQDFQNPLPFHVVETAASSSPSNVNALSGSSPKMDVVKLLTTIHGLSELLTLAHGSESSDSPEELDLINSTVQNLNMYIQNGFQEQAVNPSVVQHNSYDLQFLSNKSKLSIRDLQHPRTNNMTVDLDVRRKEKYSVVSGQTFPDSGLYQYGVTKDNGFGQVVAKSGYQHNHQGEEQINQHALFYKSLWLKAEADRCLMVYETSLSNPDWQGLHRGPLDHLLSICRLAYVQKDEVESGYCLVVESFDC